MQVVVFFGVIKMLARQTLDLPLFLTRVDNSRLFLISSV